MCQLRRAESACSSVLERFCRRVGADETGNDGGGEHGESLAREVDRFDRLLAPQLLDLERAAVETANGAESAVSAAADSKLTARFEAWGGVLDALQRLVDREHVGEVLCAVNTEAVGRDAANRATSQRQRLLTVSCRS